MQLNFLMQPIYQFQPPITESPKKSQEIQALSETDRRINRCGQIKRKASNLTEGGCASLKNRVADIDQSRLVKKMKRNVKNPKSISNEKHKNFFNELPTEIIQEICTYLDIIVTRRDFSFIINIDNEMANFLRTTRTLKKMAPFYLKQWIQKKQKIDFFQILPIQSFLGIKDDRVGIIASRCLNKFSAVSQSTYDSHIISSLLTNMKSIQSLDLADYYYGLREHLQIASTLPNLRSLELTHIPFTWLNHFVGNVPIFSNIRDLKVGPQLWSTNFKTLATMFPNVENLRLEDVCMTRPKFSDEPFKNLSSLATISLKHDYDKNDAGYCDFPIKFFFSMPNLRSLKLEKFTIQITKEALESLPFCKLNKIDFSECILGLMKPLNDAFIEKMKKMTEIEFHPPLNCRWV